REFCYVGLSFWAFFGREFPLQTPPASSPYQLRFACWNSGFDRSVTVALGLAFCSVRVR
ncbi:hypothetical protein SLEP1_g58398, partial [Rubroshorea leprosula]